jgi:hypothetical protein
MKPETLNACTHENHGLIQCTTKKCEIAGYHEITQKYKNKRIYTMSSSAKTSQVKSDAVI